MVLPFREMVPKSHDSVGMKQMKKMIPACGLDSESLLTLGEEGRMLQGPVARLRVVEGIESD